MEKKKLEYMELVEGNLMMNILKDNNWKKVCDEAFRIASVNLDSKPAPAGEMKVVLGPGLACNT